MMFKCLNNMAPEYLSKRFLEVSSIPPAYDTRHNSFNFLVVPATRLKIAARSFAISGPTVWNMLPFSLRQPGLKLLDFKSRFKRICSTSDPTVMMHC